MKYFIDTEFIEGFHKPLLGKRRHFIDLISIGIVCEDGREYYAISNEFDLKDVWNKYDIIPATPTEPKEKIYWLRDNVLKAIYIELLEKECQLIFKAGQLRTTYNTDYNTEFCYKTLKELIKRHGKSNKQIAEDVKKFVYAAPPPANTIAGRCEQIGNFLNTKQEEIKFYGYYADYDWVLFCSLFGKMIDLPEGFPMYCIDMKQLLDEKVNNFKTSDFFEYFHRVDTVSLEEKLKVVKRRNDYPKQENEHNALADAKWNKKLYEFLNTI